jgi:hypothetical protein
MSEREGESNRVCFSVDSPFIINSLSKIFKRCQKIAVNEVTFALNQGSPVAQAQWRYILLYHHMYSPKIFSLAGKTTLFRTHWVSILLHLDIHLWPAMIPEQRCQDPDKLLEYVHNSIYYVRMIWRWKNTCFIFYARVKVREDGGAAMEESLVKLSMCELRDRFTRESIQVEEKKRLSIAPLRLVEA